MFSIKDNKYKEAIRVVTALFIFTFIALGVSSINHFSFGAIDSNLNKATASLEPEFQSKSDYPFPKEEILSIGSASAISFGVGGDNNGKTLFSKKEHEKLPVASLVKLMNALVVLKNYNLNQQITISKDAMAQEGVQGVLEEGQILSVKDLLYISLIESSNRAAFALSEGIGTYNFIVLMNQEAKELGLLNTHFQDSTGLSPGSYSSSYDIAVLSKYLFLNFPLFQEIIGLEEFDVYLPDGSLHHTLETTNEMLGQKGIVGGKTGFTFEANECFMTIQEKSEGQYIIHVVLGSEDRFYDMTKLVDFVDRKYLNVN